MWGVWMYGSMICVVGVWGVWMYGSMICVVCVWRRRGGKYIVYVCACVCVCVCVCVCMVCVHVTDRLVDNGKEESVHKCSHWTILSGESISTSPLTYVSEQRQREGENPGE